MVGKSSQTAWTILMLVCMVTVRVRPGMAGRAPEVTLEVTLQAGGNGSENEDILCWYPIIRIGGCLVAVEEALRQARIDLIEATCCQAIVDLDDNCWLLMFPSEPIYPEFLKSCASETLEPAPVLAPAPSRQ